jgi:phosphate transport system ATP-binding protein
VNDDNLVLAARGLELWYSEFRALKGIDLDIERHRITAIIGPSGCGKSTLLRCFNRMNDLLPGARVEGSVVYDGRDIYSPDIDPTEVRYQIGMVFQRPNPFPRSIFDNVAFGLRVNGYRGDLAHVVERSLRRAALWEEVKDRLKAGAFSLSGGQQQRLCIARALAVDPQVLLMDEPTAAIDPIGTLAIEELLRELKREVTIVIVTHNMQQAARVSDDTVFMTMDPDRSGIIVEAGESRQIFTSPRDERTEAYITGRFG